MKQVELQAAEYNVTRQKSNVQGAGHDFTERGGNITMPAAHRQYPVAGGRKEKGKARSPAGVLQ